MKRKEFINRLMDLTLESDNATVDWKNDKHLRRNFISLIGTAFLSLVIFNIISAFNLKFTPDSTLLYRLIMILSMSILIILFFSLSYSYYQFVLINKNKIYILNIIYFYTVNVLLFGHLYLCLYSLDKSLFIYPNAPFTPTEILSSATKGIVKAKIEFMIFSAFHGVNGSYNRIGSNSIIISIISWIQSVYVLSLLTLCISSFINQNVTNIKGTGKRL